MGSRKLPKHLAKLIINHLKLRYHLTGLVNNDGLWQELPYAMVRPLGLHLLCIAMYHPHILGGTSPQRCNRHMALSCTSGCRPLPDGQLSRCAGLLNTVLKATSWKLAGWWQASSATALMN